MAAIARDAQTGGFQRMAIAAAVNDEAPEEWDSHGLPPNAIVHLPNLTSSKKYKISEIHYFDRRRWETVGKDDLPLETLTLRKGGVYTKAQLQKELETLTIYLMLEKVDMEVKPKTDATLSVKIQFTEWTWPAPKKFRCINVVPIPKSKQAEMDSDIVEKEVSEYSRPCLLPKSVHREILQMLRDQPKVTYRLLLKIRDRVVKWYNNKGYECARANLVNFNWEENLVFEVEEGVITEVVIQFIDELGNVYKGDTQLSDVRKEIPQQLQEGHIFNIKAIIQAWEIMKPLALFSIISFQAKDDEKNKGGRFVEITLKKREQESLEVSSIERTPITLITQNDVEDDDENEPLDEDYDDDGDADAEEWFDGNTSVWFWIRLIIASFSWTV